MIDRAADDVLESRTMHRVRSALLAILALGCAHENPLAPGLEGAPGIERFLVCAPNTVIALPAELQDVSPMLRKHVDAYLEFQGRQAQSIDLYDSKQLWAEAMTAAKEKGGIEKTPEFFARALDERFDFDAIVMPSILLHQVRALAGQASWDGVDRRMAVLHAPKRPTGRTQNTLAEGIAYGGIEGDVLATSVHVLVFSRTGERIFEGRGGFGFVHDVDLSMKKHTWTFVQRELTKDVGALREGIAIAFDPYLTPPEE